MTQIQPGSPASRPAASRPRLLVLTQKHCPVCAAWKVPMLELGLRRPDISVEIIDCDDNPEQWKWVRETPTFVLANGPLTGCEARVTGGLIPRVDGRLVEWWLDRVVATMRAGSCPRTTRALPPQPTAVKGG